LEVGGSLFHQIPGVGLLWVVHGTDIYLTTLYQQHPMTSNFEHECCVVVANNLKGGVIMVLGGLFDGKSSSTDTEGSSLCPRQTA
jgi:hypothetical protein